MSENWPSPPVFEHLLLESPWAVMIALLAVAVALFVIGGRMGRAPLQRCGLIAVAAAIAVVVMAELVQTQREKLEAATRKLVAAATASPIDTTTLHALLSPNVHLFSLNRDAIIALAERTQGRFKIQSNTITLLLSDAESEHTGRTLLTAFTQVRTDMGDFPTKTHWLLHWRNDVPDKGDDPGNPGAWRVEQIELLSINDQPARPSSLP